MNFFEHQEESRRHTRWLLFLFALAVLAIILSVDLAVMLAMQWAGPDSGVSMFSAQGVQENALLLGGTSLATASVVGFASLFKTLTLRGGGGEVARQLGGVLVGADTRDPLKRRLLNVVEEIAIASGTPVPEVYVLEREAGINAFAAGYSPSDAAVAVTRGTLEKLNRSELQGVIAHEFSHILNGDMRLNIRLMGALFGILLLALIGRRVLYHSRYFGNSRNKEAFPVIAAALVLMLVGYIGLFFGRWIKSSVSRAREYLADASAVQFTRDPGGISGALKKIAVYSDASWLEADTEEVGHMLFGPGQNAHLFATHPPLIKRIQRIEPGFNEGELPTLAEKIAKDSARQQKLKAEKEERALKGDDSKAPFDAARIIEQIGNPDFQQLLMAAALAASLPGPVRAVANSPEEAPALLLYSLLHQDPVARDEQLLLIARQLGPEIEQDVRDLVSRSGLPYPAQRLPLLDIALPSVKRQPVERVQKLLQVIDEIVRLDGRIEVFEYLLLRMIRQYLWETSNPHKTKLSGSRSLRRLRTEASHVVAVLAEKGQSDPKLANQAYAVGMAELYGERHPGKPEITNWLTALEPALERLDALSPGDKERLVRGLLMTVTHDQRLEPEELELMRAIGSALHVPVPVLVDGLAS